MLSCKEVTHLVSQGLDRRLSPGERLRMRLHFLICRGCTRFQQQMHFLRVAVRRLGA
jgi:hypothetical protein